MKEEPKQPQNIDWINQFISTFRSMFPETDDIFIVLKIDPNNYASFVTVTTQPSIVNPEPVGQHVG